MRKSDITKQKIFDAAEEVFAQKGLWGARIDEISESANVNKRMIYEYYGNKERLYKFVLLTVYSRLADIERNIDWTPSPIKTIENVIFAYFEFLMNSKSFVKLVMWENLNEGKFINSPEAFPVKNTVAAIVAEALERGKSERIFRTDINDEEIIFATTMFCFSYFSNVYTIPGIINIGFMDKTLMRQRANTVFEMILSQILL